MRRVLSVSAARFHCLRLRPLAARSAVAVAFAARQRYAPLFRRQVVTMADAQAAPAPAAAAPAAASSDMQIDSTNGESSQESCQPETAFTPARGVEAEPTSLRGWIYTAQTDAPPTPEGFVVHTESTTSILFAAPPAAAAAAPSSASASSSAAAAPSSATPSSTAPVFLNPVQEYNRDLSVVAIRTWSELRQQEKRTYWEEGLRRKWARKRARDANGGDGAEKYKREEHQGEGAVEVAEKGSAGEAGGAEAATEADAEAGQDAKRRKADDGAVAPTAAATAPAAEGAAPAPEPASVGPHACPRWWTARLTCEALFPQEDPQQQQLPPPPTYKFSLLEALSATGLRAIRYAKELPLLRSVLAANQSRPAKKASTDVPT